MAKISIKIRAYEAILVDQAAKKIFEIASKANIKMSGPIPMPLNKKIFTVLRAPHIFKPSREQFEMRTHKRLIIFKNATPQFIEILKRIEMPAGVNFVLSETPN